MKRLLIALLAALMILSAFSVAVLAADKAVYISYNKGADKNDGLSDASPKKSLGSPTGTGAFSVIANGGTLVICEKLYFGDNYTWQASGATTITASYGGKSYVNASPSTNPASGVLKIKPGCTLTVASDLTLDDMILFSEGSKDTIVVKSGAKLTITDKVRTMTKTTYNFNIVVEAGGSADIRTGTYSSITGDGDIKIADGVKVSKQSLIETSDAYVYVSYNKGNNEYNGLSESTPKKSLGSTDGNGIMGVLNKGGTLIICEKFYIGNSFSWNTKGKVTITANFGGKDYKNAEPASNPASGSMKMRGGSTLTVASDLTLDDMILFQENEQCTIVVAAGATFTVNENVIAMSNRDHFMKVLVAKGGKAVINGGIFDSVSGEGEIVIGPKAKVLKDAAEIQTEEPPKREPIVCYLDFKNGSNDNDGTSADKAVKGYSAGLFKRMVVGGTVVVIGGGSAIGGNYTMPTLPKPVTFTSVYGGKDYRADNSACTFSLTGGAVWTIASDVVLDNLLLRREENAATIKLTNGAVLTVTDTVNFVTEAADGSHFTLQLDKGTTAILSDEARARFTVSGEGKVISYRDGFTELFGDYLGASAVVQLTIGSPTAYLNGTAYTLDAAPINRNNRTMLPVRFLANAFGVDNDGILWDGATRTATLKNATTSIVITIGAPSMTVNGAEVALDSPAIIEHDRTYLPVRAIANALGVSNDNIVWDGTTSTATLMK